MVLLAAASIFFSSPAPLDMPRAQAFLVKEDGVRRLEDRYNRLDLWVSQTVEGRWTDDDGRVFTLSRLSSLPPAVDTDAVETRTDHEKWRTAIPKKDLRKVRRAIARLSPVPVAEKGEPPRQMPRGYADVDYWQGTNTGVVVCTFLREKSDTWHLAVWELAEGDDDAERVGVFEDVFLAKEFPAFLEANPAPPPRNGLSERELLRLDAHHSVTNYSGWRFTDAPEFTILDDLPGGSGFITALTNELSSMRAKYAAAVPSPIDSSNALCVARIYGTRDEYLAAAGEDMEWSAAYWSQERRELVAHLPADGEAKLLETIRHEAFHQYLSYAASMIPASPWFNEGYAQYFEDESSVRWGMEVDIDAVAELIPAVLAMDYEAFYAGSDVERRLKYRIAWSIAHFLEKGAPKVRFKPFEKVKADYIDTLLKTQNMHSATDAVFRNSDFVALFITEWKRFWKNT